MKTILRSIGIAALALSFCGAMAVPTIAQVAMIGVSVNFAPPDLPVYEQPPCPGEDYIWTPGYWAWDDDYGDYYWVPGTWVLAPQPGYFWTPGYWAWSGRGFVFTAGYWGPVVGFYGGINYGFGYFGHGYEGGRWDRGHFFYNREVNNVNVNIVHNTYNTTIVNNNTNVTRVSYNGGNGGVNVRPTSQEEAAAREHHIAPVAAQTQHVQEARSNPELRSNENHGRPPIAATEKPDSFKGNGVVAAREGGAVHGNGARPEGGNGAGAPPENRGRTAPQPGNGNSARPTYSHAKDIPASVKPSTPNTGDPKLDKKYQQEQEKLAAKQAQEQQKLEQKQELEHQNLQKQQGSAAKQQQMEQRHQQQAQQMAQRHEQQVQRMQQRQQPPPQHPPHKP